MNYYQERLLEIRQLIDAGDLDEAEALVDEELAMPYIPQAYLSQFETFKRSLRQAKRQASPLQGLQDPEAIRELLGKESLSQLKALDALSKLNLRAHDGLIREAFGLLEDRLLINLLIRLGIEQALTEEYSFSDEGIRYTFIPAALVLPEDSDGVQEAKRLLADWLDKDPSLLKLALEQLELTGLLKLPESYESDEAETLALEILKPLFIQLQDEKAFREFLVSRHLPDPDRDSTL